MASVFGSVFHYAGNIQSMKMKISLSRISPGPGAVGLENTNILVDEVACSWKEIRTRKVIPNYERPEPRIFTIAAEDEKLEGEEAKKSAMDIFAYLGDLSDTDDNHVHDSLICRITSFGRKTLIVEPPLTTAGFQLEGKLGDYLAKIYIYEDSFSTLADDFARMEILNLPDAGVFDLSEESSVTMCYNITIEIGRDFPFKAIALQWKAASQFLKNSKSSGCTGFAHPITINSEELWNFSYTFSLNLNISMTDISIGITNPMILLEADSEDGWGRQWIAGYACLTLPLAAGRSKQRVSLWRPFDPDPISQLKEFFLGSPVELDSDNFLKDGCRRMFGMHTEAGGSLDVSITTVIHSRHFMAHDTLHHVKYGKKLGQIGLKTDLYWRIMKVLLEFEEARQMLLRARK